MQDLLEAEVVEAYDDGIEIVRRKYSRSDRPEHLVVYCVTIPDGPTFEFPLERGGQFFWGPRRRAGVWVALWRRLDGVRRVDDPGLVPVEVAVLGKPAIAAYLFAAHGVSVGEVAERVNEQPATVKQFLRKVHDRRR